jgi:hypothetical protein
MNTNIRTRINIWLLSAFLTAGLTAVAQANTKQAVASQPAASREISEPKFVVLQDKLHLMNDSLTSRHPDHYYGFVAQRGQDVLLTFPGGDPVKEAWKVEYYEKGDWHVQNLETKVFSNLAPGAEVIIRITPRDPASKANISYALNFGSYPVLKKYDLHDEPGVIRIPSGYTEPGWLATQAYKEVLLEVKFTDTKDAPLEGGLAYFRLLFDKDSGAVRHTLVSDADGSASRRVELGRCSGGKQARDFVHKQRGFDTWRSYYKVGDYSIQNLSLAATGKKPHTFQLGHICSQKLVQTVRPRN